MRRFAPALAALLVAGCAARGPVLAPALPDPADHTAVELTETPFFPQTEYYCGPAALATVLGASGVDVEPESLASRVYLPGKRGSLQIELVAATRRYQRLPYRIDAGLGDLLGEVRDGRPVLVFQNLGIKLIPVWHYAVVVGYDPAEDVVVLRSGTERRRVMPADDFMDTWKRADKWGFVALRPGELPAAPEPGRYLSAVAAMEAAATPAAALSWLTAAQQRWPRNAMVQFALGNNLYDSGRRKDAEAAYRRALALDPGLLVARNNLAHLLSERGCTKQALAEIDRALAAANGSRAELKKTLVQTRSEITAKMAAADGACTLR